jgi:benzil reductase ((S)-benzoin forming)
VMRVLITGHSRGFGAALAREVLARGGAVWGLSRRPLADPPAGVDGRFLETAIDLAATEELEKALARLSLEDWFGGSDPAVLVNNAGVLGPVDVRGGLEEGAVRRATTLDLVVPIVLTGVFLRVTAGSRDRRVAHVSSGAGRRAVRGWAVYGACKAALDHHARTLAAEGRARFRIASVAPGILDTDMQAEIRRLDPDSFPERDRFVGLHREGRLVAPSVAAARFLDHVLSDAFGEETIVDLRDIP